MEQQIIFEIIGYLGSALVIVSMMMTSMIKLRYFNASGCILTIVYTVIIGSYPVLALNSILLLINSFHIFKYYTKQVDYDVINANITGDTLKHFLNKYRTKILMQNPLFFNRYPDSNYAKVVFCDDTVVGMIVGRRKDDELEVFMDYLDPNYMKKDLIRLIHNIIHNDGINKEQDFKFQLRMRDGVI